MADFRDDHWFLKDLQYEYLDDGFKLTATTDVPCHLFCRMTTTPPRKHALPSYRRGLALQGDIRFCFVVYEDNEQVEAGDTLTHTWLKDAWPVCETRWFYFIGTIAGQPSPSESPIFKFHFPAPPPEPPPPLLRVFLSDPQDRLLYKDAGTWNACHDAPIGLISNRYSAPWFYHAAGVMKSISYWCYRCNLFFDTSDMPDTAKILNAHLALYVTVARRTSNPALPHIFITQGVQNKPIITANYGDQLPYTDEWGRGNIETMVINAYNNLDLNPLGIANINLSGETRLCLRGEQDVGDFPPVVGQNQIRFHSYQKGTGYLPLLYVYYYPA